MLKQYSEYKLTEIPWDKFAPLNWDIKRGKVLFYNPKEINKNNICKNILSLTLRGVINNDIDRPIGLAPKSYDTYQLFKKNDLVFKLIDLENISTSRVGLVHEDGVMSPAYIRLVSKNIEHINIRYFYYQYYALYLRSIYNGLGAGVRQTLSGTDLINLFIMVPTHEEQNQIVRFLDWKISEMAHFVKEKRKEIKLLQELKLSLINNAVTRGIDSNVGFKDSGHAWIGDIPEHWEMLFSKKLFKLRRDKALPNDEQLTSSQKYGIISQKEYMRIENRRLTVVMTGEDILKHVEVGDFVISMRSFQGGIEYSHISGKISSAYVMLIPNNELVFDRYFRWLLKSPSYIKALQGTSDLVRDGQALRYSNFAKVYLPNIPLDEQEAIADYLDDMCPKIDEMIDALRSEIKHVIELRTKTISDVVTGKVDVRNVEIPRYEPETDDLLDEEEMSGDNDDKETVDEEVE